MAWLAEAGLYGPIRLRTDEVSIRAVAAELAARRRAATLLEITPVGSSNSLGLAERACAEVGGMTRTLRLAAEAVWQFGLGA